MRLSEAAPVVRGILRGEDCLFEGVSIDSRRTRRGDLFVAVCGRRCDGHDFIGQAGQRGAAGALVSATSRHRIAQIKVDDTSAALGRLGAHWRRRFDRPVVAVTGSSGKTTVCRLLASILNQGGNCLAPRASFNNQWGVPLTLLRMRERHTHVVIEMGMNRRGEIETLSALTTPTIALINNVSPAHLDGLADLQSIAAAKAEIFSGLERTGTAVLNADDRFYDYWRQRAGVDNILSFGLRAESNKTESNKTGANKAGANKSAANKNDAEVSAAAISGSPAGSEFELRIARRRVGVRLPLPGRHNVVNALAAAAAAHAAGAGLRQIKSGLESATAAGGRLCPLDGLHGARIIDDSYNANPASSKAALDVLAGSEGERIAVFGCMAELGGQSDEFHYQVGLHARRCGIERLVGFGPADSSKIANYVRGFGPGAQRFDDLGDLLENLVPMLGGGVTVLVKGSRSAGMERVVSGLVALPEGGLSC